LFSGFTNIVSQADEVLMDKDGTLPASFLTLVDKAFAATDKLLKEGFRLSKDKNLADKAPIMKQAYQALSKHQRELDHVKCWGEIPGAEQVSKMACDKFLSTIAEDVAKYNREIEAAKGQLKALKN